MNFQFMGIDKVVKKFILLSFLYINIDTSAKARFVELSQELESAQYIDMVKVVSYTDSTIIMCSVKGNEIISAKIPGRPPAEYFFPDCNWWECKKHFTTTWPRPGQFVLVVIAENGWISLFAYGKGDYFRFWSPLETGSSAYFYSWFSR
jgi:hypothetical protein